MSEQPNNAAVESDDAHPMDLKGNLLIRVVGWWPTDAAPQDGLRKGETERIEMFLSRVRRGLAIATPFSIGNAKFTRSCGATLLLTIRQLSSTFTWICRKPN